MRKTLLLFILLIQAMRGGAQQVRSGTLDRKAIVNRHNVTVTVPDEQSPVQVGNGEFAFGADITGLQTFAPFVTMSQWGWHSFPLPSGLSVDSFHGQTWDTHGRPVTYEIGNTDQPGLSRWLAENPHRLNLGRIGFKLIKPDGSPAQLTDIKNALQELDIWQGIITSYFELDGIPVKVITTCHGSMDAIGVHVESPLIKLGRLAVSIDFPYGNIESTGADWTKPDAHKTALVLQGGHRAIFRRSVDSTKYNVYLNWAKEARLEEVRLHRFVLTPSPDNGALEFVCVFSPPAQKPVFPSFGQVIASARSHWKAFWESGGAIDLSASKDSRWKELERRIVLSQYLMAVNEAGSLPPQESGLANNSGWYGRFHYEMYWWHAAHYALWNRWDLLDESIGVYKQNLWSSKVRAQRQGYTGARWPKCTGPDGRNWPHPIHALLIWQQPHPLFFAEMDYQAHPTKATLEKWKDIVMETASFMASYAFYDNAKKEYVLGPPVYMVAESNDPKTTQNPIFELAYWKFGLRIAQTWRERLGLSRDTGWDRVLNGLSPLPQQNGLYVSFEGVKDMWTKWNWEHPSLIGIFGMLPGDGVDTAIAGRTFKRVLETWNFDHTWGWDFPMLAMCAARLGQPGKAVDMLMNPAAGFQFDEHGLATGGPFPYFPSNGGLLYAVAMMAAGWKGAPGGVAAPGFPSDGSWTVKWEGLKPAL